MDRRFVYEKRNVPMGLSDCEEWGKSGKTAFNGGKHAGNEQMDRRFMFMK